MKKREASVESVLPEAGAEGCRVTGPDCGRERVCSTWLQRGFKFSSHGSALTVKHRAKVGLAFILTVTAHVSTLNLLAS